MSAREDLTPSLVVRLRAGDGEAGALLDALYRERMARFCAGYLPPDEVEDAVQEVFCRVLAAEKVPDAFRAWVYTVARNHCLNRRRTVARRPEASLDPGRDAGLAASATGALTRLVRDEARRELARALSGLSPAQREVLRLRYVEGLSRAETASVVGATEAQVKSRAYEGLKRLRAATGAE